MEPDFYFNEWSFLARTDPEIFERRRKETIGSFLEHAGAHRPRLEALQACIDARRSLAADPRESVVTISLLMCESLCSLAGEMQNLCVDLHELEPPQAGRIGVAAQADAPGHRRPAPALRSRVRSE